jgi:hypothetical protein
MTAWAIRALLLLPLSNLEYRLTLTVQLLMSLMLSQDLLSFEGFIANQIIKLIEFE